MMPHLSPLVHLKRYVPTRLHSRVMVKAMGAVGRKIC